MKPIGLLSHSDCLKHDTGPGHPESPARLAAVMQALKTCRFASSLDFIDAPKATAEQLRRVHTEPYIHSIGRSPHDVAPLRLHMHLDADTVISLGTWNAALRAAGAGCAAVDGVLGGDYAGAFCAVRPPGHHALPGKAMGFCVFNNIAIAACHAMEHHGIERIAIVDFDVHHGNGTQAVFEHDDRVLYISTHQAPYYPGTGQVNEKGAGNLLNLPMPAGTDGKLYRKVFIADVIPALQGHRPQLLLVSAGFDAHRDDPLANLRLTDGDYSWIGGQLRQVAQEHCEGRIVSMLEGGYNTEALAAGVVSYLAAFAE